MYTHEEYHGFGESLQVGYDLSNERKPSWIDGLRFHSGLSILTPYENVSAILRMLITTLLFGLRND